SSVASDLANAAAHDLSTVASDLAAQSDFGSQDFGDHVCISTCSLCGSGACCGGGCCAPGEWCENGACRCGTGAACAPGLQCASGGAIGDTACGFICCGQ